MVHRGTTLSFAGRSKYAVSGTIQCEDNEMPPDTFQTVLLIRLHSW